jgi:hypothetical protein
MSTGGSRDARSLCACGASGKRKQRDVARALDGFAKPALVTCADAGHAARQNLSAFLHELRKNVGTLVVDEVHFLDAKLADFLFAKILALAAARTAWSTRTAARTIAARTAVTSTGSTMAAARTVSTGARAAGS